MHTQQLLGTDYEIVTEGGDIFVGVAKQSEHVIGTNLLISHDCNEIVFQSRRPTR